jgi:hypothetical protein
MRAQTSSRRRDSRFPVPFPRRRAPPSPPIDALDRPSSIDASSTSRRASRVARRRVLPFESVRFAARRRQHRARFRAARSSSRPITRWAAASCSAWP